MTNAEAISTIQKIRTLADQLERGLSAPKALPEWELRYGETLKGLAEAGRPLTQSEWHQLGKKNGYDPRGLGGFFTWRKSVAWTGPNDSQVVLTDMGRKNYEWYLGEIKKLSGVS